MTGAHAHPHAASPAPDLAGQLRARGLRMTAQREQVFRAVRELGHATPDAISDAVDGVDLATVYRTLEVLEEIGLVRHTHLGHGAPSYRPADDDHIHVVCHTCGRVVEAPPDAVQAVDALAAGLRTDAGFVLDRSHLTVFGHCRDCAVSEAAGEHTAPSGR